VKTAWRDGDRDFFGATVVPTRARALEIQIRLSARGRVIILDDYYDDAAMAALHARGDCYVSLTHAEGWGLGAFEAAAAGNPVIITGFGGAPEFLPPDLASFVDYEMGPAVGHGFERRVYCGEGRWAMPSVKDGSRLMRWAFENREEARRRGRCLREHVRREFSAARVMQRYIDAIESTPAGGPQG
jgi:glycosyltransferase involved in cell wall biosynthesis